MSEGEENMADEPEEVTRCVCGNIDLKLEDEDEDTGLFVQCDKCLVWQHGYCVGLLDNSQVPDTYFCELCRPDLHKLIHRPRKVPRSKFLGIDNASSPPAAPQTDDLGGILDETETSSSRKRRSTMNSRDAAYDRQLEAALLLSAQQHGGTVEMPAPSVSGRSGRIARRQSPTLSKRGRTPSPSPNREDTKQKRRRKGATGQIKREEATVEEDQASVSSTRRRGGGGSKKKGAANRSAAVASVAADIDEQNGAGDAGNPSSTSSSRPRSANADRTAAASVKDDSRPPSRMASRESTPVPPAATGNSRKRGSARNNKKSGPPAVSRGNTNASVVPPSTPSGGRLTAMSEMRKRVSTILEFVGRMQEEMATEVTEWSQFVPEEEFALVDNKQRREDSVWGYGYGEGGSVMLMEELTGNLLRWETLYG